MSDQSAGFTPDEGTPVHDAALDAMMAQWARSPDPIDVEGALARVTARRRALTEDAEPSPAVDDLAARRADRRRPSAAPPLWRRSGVRAAAAIVAVIGVTAFWRTTQTATSTEYSTAIGASRLIRLSDGTDVRLGPSSSLALDPGFGTDHRHLTLHGEAWFKVSHDASKPFAIRVGTTTVEDIGTAFQVRESPSREVSVRVSEGVVRLTTPAASSRDSSVMLRAGDGAVATTSGIVVAAGVVTPSEGAAMASGRLTFTDASLVEVQEALRRWYGVHLEIADAALSARHVTADFTGEPMSRVAAVLGLTLGASAELRGDTIELRGASGVPARP
ncbi:MAG: FecR domain-containing protein [Gemmatimonadaceae bacterium]|nr:FecR domain-containing protein [Gemmatimonadaceae bacterium]